LLSGKANPLAGSGYLSGLRDGGLLVDASAAVSGGGCPIQAAAARFRRRLPIQANETRDSLA
jgi:hypothetical protein